MTERIDLPPLRGVYPTFSQDILDKLTVEQKDEIVYAMLHLCLWLGWMKVGKGYSGAAVEIVTKAREFIQKHTGASIPEYT